MNINANLHKKSILFRPIKGFSLNLQSIRKRKMKKVLVFISLVALFACGSTPNNKTILTQTFDASGWERFSPVYSDMEISEPTTYDLSLKVGFTTDYSDKDFNVVFTVFDSEGTPYRAKSYSFRLKDNDGSWKSECKGGIYEFEFPINSSLSIGDPGKYRFQLDSRMPITPLLGIHKLELINNGK